MAAVDLYEKYIRRHPSAAPPPVVQATTPEAARAGLAALGRVTAPGPVPMPPPVATPPVEPPPVVSAPQAAPVPVVSASPEAGVDATMAAVVDWARGLGADLDLSALAVDLRPLVAAAVALEPSGDPAVTPRRVVGFVGASLLLYGTPEAMRAADRAQHASAFVRACTEIAVAIYPHVPPAARPKSEEGE